MTAHHPSRFAALSNAFVFCLFGSMFVQPKPVAISLLLAIAMSVLLLSSARLRQPLNAAFLKPWRYFLVPLGAWFALHLVVAFAHPPMAWSSLGNPARAVLGIGALLFLLLNPPSLKAFIAGVALACAACFVGGFYDQLVLHRNRSIGWFNNEMHFGEFCGLVAVLAITIGFLAHFLTHRMRVGFLLLGGLAILGAVTSGTRTSFFALVCLVPLAIGTASDRFHKKLQLACLAAALAVAGVLVFSEKAQEKLRITEARSDIQTMLEGRANSSIGDRKEMWLASVDMFKESPWLGIGLQNYRAALVSRIQDKKILPLSDIQNQAHSQLLHSAATGGLVLLAAYMVFMLLPLYWFVRNYRARHASARLKLVSYLGMAHSVSYLLFGLTVATFDIQVFSSSYVLTLVALAALSLREIATPVAQHYPKHPTKTSHG